MIDASQKRLWEKLGKKTVKALKKHEFDAHFVETTDKARELILEMVSSYETFGFAGSHTTRVLGVWEVLKRRGKTLFDHWQEGLSAQEDLRLRLEQGRCDCFFCSANAISATGEIVNVDGVGNRTSAMAFGPKKVVIVAGMNKVRPTLETALGRVKEISAPVNAVRFGMQPPCTETGICTDCESPQRICRVTTILHRQPLKSDLSVVLINEDLGY